MIPLCLNQGVGVIPWSPLARGLLAGNRERGGVRKTVRAGNDPYGDSLYGEDDFDVVDALRQVAAQAERSAAQVALAWLLSKPVLTAPIVGATKPGHLADAIAAVDLTLSEEQIAALEAPYRPHPVLGHS
jgi:aryl-alcohol dehydrogenase-like predicted oxidoreductase